MPVTALEWRDASLFVSDEATEQRILLAVLDAPTWETPLSIDLDPLSQAEVLEGMRCR